MMMIRVFYCGHLDPGTIAQGKALKGKAQLKCGSRMNPVKRKIKDQCSLSEAHPEEKV